MAIADMLVQSTLNQAGKDPGVGDAIVKGADLALKVQAMQQQKAALEQKKQEHEQQKYEKVGAWYETASKMPDGAAKKAFVNSYIPNGIKALGLADKIDPTVLGMLNGDPALASFLKQQISEGKATMTALSSPEELAQLAASPEYLQFGGQEALKNTVSEYRPSLDEAQKKRIEENETNKRAKMAADAAMSKQIQGQDAAPEVEFKKKALTRYETWIGGGGLAAREKTREIFNDAIKRLREGKVKLGTVGKNIPWIGDPEKLPIGDAAAKELLDDIRGGISIREKTGDPNPTAQQISMVMSRAIDPRLDNDANIRKLQIELDAMDRDTKEKLNLFKRYNLPVTEPEGAKDNWKIKARAVKDKVKALTPEKQKRFLDALAEKLNTPVADIRKEIGL